MLPYDIASTVQELVSSSLLVGLPIAALAGLVSFFSPCVVPLLPGYLSYATGLSAAQVIQGRAARGRMLAGTVLFVLGFAVVFVITGAVAGGIGRLLLEWQPVITRVLGVAVIVVGLIFAGWLPFGRRDLRSRRVPAVGVAAAPLLGMVFGLGWTPCIGPTLQVVSTMAFTSSSALQGGVLAFAYALGLGVPFVVAGLAFARMARTVEVLRRHQRTMMRIGGVIMMLIGIAMVSGAWNWMIGQLRGAIFSFGVVI